MPSNAPHNWIDLKADKLVCGVRWDPNKHVGLKDKVKTILGRNKETYDLDLSVYLYSEKRALLDYVTGMPGETSDKTGFVLHSGDDRDGVRDGDDESVIIDIKNLPLYITDIICVVEVASAHAFSDIAEPSVHLTGDTNESPLLSTELDKENTQANTSACVFAHIHRETGSIWHARDLNTFVNHEDIEDWSDYLTNFLS